MEATIEHTEVAGGFLWCTTYYCVGLTVTFTDREREIIKRHKLQNTLIVKRGPSAGVPWTEEQHNADPYSWWLTIRDVFKRTNYYYCHTPLEAKNYDHVIRKALPAIKRHIEGNVFVPTKAHWYEV